MLLDEIHVKPDVGYQGNHIIGFLHDKPTKAARTVLFIMIAPMMGALAFVCRLIPVYPLKHDLTLQQSQKVITLIHQNRGYTFLLMNYYLRANHACFNLYREIFGSTVIFSCKHPVQNGEFENLYLLYDPTHLLKNISRLKKMQKLKFTDSIINKDATTKWSDLIGVYKIDKDSRCKLTKLNHATLYPTNFGKQEVT